jgi:hypothetical protein
VTGFDFVVWIAGLMLLGVLLIAVLLILAVMAYCLYDAFNPLRSALRWYEDQTGKKFSRWYVFKQWLSWAWSGQPHGLSLRKPGGYMSTWVNPKYPSEED